MGLVAKRHQWDWQYMQAHLEYLRLLLWHLIAGHQAGGRLLGRRRSGLRMGAAEVRVDENFPWLDQHGARLELWLRLWLWWWTMAGGGMGTYKGTNTGYTQLSHFIVNTLRRDKIANIWQTTFSNVFFDSENVWISIKISLKFVPRGPINNIPALIQIMAWCYPGDKPLSEPMLVSLTMHICVTWPQWVDVLNWLVETSIYRWMCARLQ